MKRFAWCNRFSSEVRLSIVFNFYRRCMLWTVAKRPDLHLKTGQEHARAKAGKSNYSGRLSTIDLLLLTSLRVAF